MSPLPPDRLRYLMRYLHPQKVTPSLDDVALARIFEIDPPAYRAMLEEFRRTTRQAAAELLDDAAFAGMVDLLPFAPGSAVVGLGDSITDDCLSWLEILRDALDLRRGGDKIRVVNLGFSGDSTCHSITRFGMVIAQKPDWIIYMGGSNDARRHGKHPTKVLVSADETERNMRMMRNYAATQTAAKWVWMTPTPIIENLAGRHWFLGPLELAWLKEDLQAVANIVVRMGELFVDLHAAFGDPPKPDLFMDDGLHPSLEGQKVILQAFVTTLAAGR